MLIELDDGELLRAYIDGADERAFDELVRRYTPLVQQVCRSVLGDCQSADDAIQDTFVALINKAPALDGSTPLGGWLRVAAQSCARQLRRSRLRRQRREQQFARMAANDQGSAPREDSEAILPVLETLPPNQRLALILRYIEQRPEEEAARIVGCPQRTLHNRVVAGMATLRIRLRSQGRELGTGGVVALLGTIPQGGALAQALHHGARHGTFRLGTWLAQHTALVVGATAAAIGLAVTWSALHQPPPLPVPPASAPAPAPAAAIAAANPPATVPSTQLPARSPAAPLTSLPPQRNPPARLMPGFGLEASGVCFLPDGSLLACGFNHWLLHARPPAMDGLQNLPFHASGMLSVAASPDQQWLAGGNEDGTVLLWHADDPSQPARILSGHHDHVMAVAFSPDGRRLASAGKDGVLLVRDVASGAVQLTCTLGGGWIVAVAWSPDGGQLASVGDDHVGTIWDGASGAVLGTLRGHTSSLRAVAWEADGRHLDTAGGDRTVRRWTAEGEQVSCWTLDDQHQDPDCSTTGIACSRDGRLLAAVTRTGTLRLWSLASGELVHRQQVPGIRFDAVAFSPDSSAVAAVGTQGWVGWWRVRDLIDDGSPGHD